MTDPTEDNTYFTRLTAGSDIFREGDAAAEMFIIQEGQVEICKQVDGQERRVAVLEEGDFFGEMAILEDLPRSASARALTACLMIRMDRATFDKMARHNPEIPIRMLRKLCRRLRATNPLLLDVDPGPETAGTPPLPTEIVSQASAILTKDTKPPPPPVAPDSADSAAPPPPPGAGDSIKPPEPPEPPPLPVVAEGAAPPTHPTPAPPPPPAPPAPPAAPVPPRAAPDLDPPTEPIAGESIVHAKLVHLASQSEFFLAPGPETFIGRFDAAAGFNPDIDLRSIDTEHSISRRHAKILRREDGFFIREEVGTTNGTYVNGQRIAVGQDFELANGDEVSFGLSRTTFEIH